MSCFAWRWRFVHFSYHTRWKLVKLFSYLYIHHSLGKADCFLVLNGLFFLLELILNGVSGWRWLRAIVYEMPLGLFSQLCFVLPVIASLLL